MKYCCCLLWHSTDKAHHVNEARPTLLNKRVELLGKDARQNSTGGENYSAAQKVIKIRLAITTGSAPIDVCDRKY